MWRINKIVDFFIFSNVFIAIAAVAFTLESLVQIGLKPTWDSSLYLIFFATLFEYNSHKFVTVFFNKDALKEPKFDWIRRNTFLFYILTFLSFFGFVVAAWYTKWMVLVTLFPLGIITILYSFPVYIRGNKLFRIREFPFVKIFIISFVWSATCIVLPMVQSEKSADLLQLLLFIGERFLFVYAITIPFDVRDMESDRQNKLKTLPLLLGEKRAMKSANVAMLLFIVVCCVHYSITHQWQLLLAFVFSGLTTLIALNSRLLRSWKHYHYGVLDGTMLLQGLLVVLFYYFMPS